MNRTGKKYFQKKKPSEVIKSTNVASNQIIGGGERGQVVRALDLKAGGPGFKTSFLLLDGFVFGGPEFNPSMLCI